MEPSGESVRREECAGGEEEAAMRKKRQLVLSAPGKVILHGEHAVVHGKLALAAALNLRTFLRLTLIEEEEGNEEEEEEEGKEGGQVRLLLPNLGLRFCWETLHLNSLLLAKFKNQVPKTEQLEAVKAFILLHQEEERKGGEGTPCVAAIAFLFLYLAIASQREANCSLCSLEVVLWSELPTGSGLGSSAAFCVCLSGALLSAFGIIDFPSLQKGEGTHRWTEAELEAVNGWAFRGEQIIHGNPSGVDNAVSTWGGALRYQSGKISPLKKFPTLRILLTNTKVPRSTKVLVSGVKDKLLKFPSIMDPILMSMNAISEECEKTLQKMAEAESPSKEHYVILEELIDLNQSHLNALGVGHPSLDAACRVTAAFGLHTKLTGAGGGGCALTLLPPDVDPGTIASALAGLSDCGFDCFETVLGGPGLSLHLLPSLKANVLQAFNEA
ncbi:mevalonate kinase isoform X1 [Anolis sagrei]|uniref:mevalonate kinase isoform X1 n=1 Tax=Anolis sagrei TaxID=38937 RepID=UPI003520502A